MSRSFGTELQVLGDLDGDGFDEFLLFDPALAQLDGAARAAFWLLSSREWICRGGDVDLPPTIGRMSAVLLPDQDGDGCLDFGLMEEGLFDLPGGLAVYSGASAEVIRTIALQSGEHMLGAWHESPGTGGGLAWLTRDGSGKSVAVHSEGKAASAPIELAALGLETLERLIPVNSGELQPELAFTVIGKGRDRNGLAGTDVLICDSTFGRARGRWRFPADRWVTVVACRAPGNESLAALLEGERALLIRVADGSVSMDIRIDEQTIPPAGSACILPDDGGGRGSLLLGMVDENLSAGRIDEYPLCVADRTRSIGPPCIDGYGFGHAMSVVRAGSSAPPILLVGTDCRMGGCEGRVLLVDPRDGRQLGEFSRVSRSQLQLRQ